MTEPDSRHDQVVGALGAVLAVALVIGGVLGAVAYGAVRFSGLTDPADTAAAQPARPQTSSAGSAVRSPEESARPEESPRAEESPRPERTQADRKQVDRTHADRSREERKRKRAGTAAAPRLSADVSRVGKMGRINLTGRYPGHGGSRLVVQRYENGHWSRFPVSTVTVRDGRFHTWVASGRPGPNRFRVLDVARHRPSNPVTVVVR